MADANTPADEPLTGKMFLFEQPELLNKEQHGKLGITRREAPFGFAREIRAVPVTVGEIATMQKAYPVVFSDLENPVPLAIVGIFEDRNLFVDDEGRWDPDHHVPAYLRCHPIAFARRSDDQYAVVIDRSSGAISEAPQFPFFDGDKLAAEVQTMVDFCATYDRDRRRTQEICEAIKALGLLSAQQAAGTPPGSTEEKPIANYVAVDASKLDSIEKDALMEIHKSGALATIFAHLYSLENWGRLLHRRSKLSSADAS
ncbi:MAG: SapC family protein [Pseudomonadota bacterium]